MMLKIRCVSREDAKNLYYFLDEYLNKENLNGGIIALDRRRVLIEVKDEKKR